MEYTGTLKKTTAIDFCETEAARRRDDAERVWGFAPLTESASIKVEITVYGEAGRGVWVKDDGAVTKNVSGHCDAPNSLDSEWIPQRGRCRLA